MMIRESLRTFFFQRVLDHFLSIALIFLLMVAAIKLLDVARQTAEVCARIASQNDRRVDMHYTFALTGEWPRDSGSLLSIRTVDAPSSSYSGDEVKIENGAINIRATSGSISGATISLRPAIPDDNATGPVSWVVGSGLAGNGRLISGDDATTINPSLIPASMK